MRTLLLNNTGIRLIFSTGILALVLSVLAAVDHVLPLTESLAAVGVSTQVMQQITMVSSLLLLAGARIAARREGRKACSTLHLLAEFWEFRPGRVSSRSHRLLEWAHLCLIATMFLRALFG